MEIQYVVLLVIVFIVILLWFSSFCIWIEKNQLLPIISHHDHILAKKIFIGSSWKILYIHIPNLVWEFGHCMVQDCPIPMILIFMAHLTIDIDLSEQWDRIKWLIWTQGLTDPQGAIGIDSVGSDLSF